jgi:hypothetical protein
LGIIMSHLYQVYFFCSYEFHFCCNSSTMQTGASAIFCLLSYCIVLLWLVQKHRNIALNTII